MSFPRYISIPLVFVVALFAWVALFAFLGKAAIPGRYLLSSSCYRPGFELVRVAFEKENVEHCDYVIVGTENFSKKIIKKIPDSRSVVEIHLQTLSLAQYAEVLNIFTEKKPKYFILQNAPHFWTDIQHNLALGKQQTALWSLYGKDVEYKSLFNTASASLRAMIDLAVSPCLERNRKNKSGLPGNFLWVSFLPEPLLSETIDKYHRAVRNKRAIDNSLWVFDPDWLPPDTMEDTRTALYAFAGSPKKIDKLGQFVNLGQVGKHL